MNRLNNKILILEPNEGIRESLKLILEADYNLLFSNSPDEAQKHLSHFSLRSGWGRL